MTSFAMGYPQISLLCLVQVPYLAFALGSIFFSVVAFFLDHVLALCQFLILYWLDTIVSQCTFFSLDASDSSPILWWLTTCDIDRRVYSVLPLTSFASTWS